MSQSPDGQESRESPEPAATPSAVRFWSPEAQAAFEATRAVLHSPDAVVELAAAALRADDAAALCGVLRAADALELATELRFACGIRAMDQRKFGCGVAAWEDDGRTFARTGSSLLLPSSSEAAEVLARVCLECAALVAAVADRVGDDLARMRL
jgi:hypothetical protein